MLEEPKIKKVDKRDKQLPQNFEQLIEMYDVEKIWPYMKKVIDYVNNDLEKIKVSPKQPTTNEKIWIQKGKNLSKKSGFDAVNSDIGIATVKIKVEPNTSYTISAIKSRIGGVNIKNVGFQGIGAIQAYDVLGNIVEDFFRDNAHYLESGSVNIEFPITTPANCDYIIVDFGNNNGDFNLNISVSNIQVEQGSTATEYEEYVERKINVDGEEFLDVEKANAQQNYSTEEQVIGTWIDKKPLYRKVIEFPNGTGNTSVNTYNLSDFGINNVAHIHLGSPTYYTNVNNHIPFNYNDGNIFEAQVNPNNLLVHVSYEPIANNYMLFTLEYTKTTD